MICYVPGRASVGLHTEIYFGNNPTEEEAFVLSVDKDKISVIVPRFGIEGPVSFIRVRAPSERRTLVPPPIGHRSSLCIIVIESQFRCYVLLAGRPRSWGRPN